ncbi:MAG: STAS domain-containing protein [Acidimicrobiales bacterium]
MSGGPESSQQLDVDVNTSGETATIRLVGELDVHTAPALVAVLANLLDDGVRAVEVDAAELRFCDSSGLQALVSGRERVLAQGGSLVVSGVHGPVEKVLAITGLKALLTAT